MVFDSQEFALAPSPSSAINNVDDNNHNDHMRSWALAYALVFLLWFFLEYIYYLFRSYRHRENFDIETGPPYHPNDYGQDFSSASPLRPQPQPPSSPPLSSQALPPLQPPPEFELQPAKPRQFTATVIGENGYPADGDCSICLEQLKDGEIFMKVSPCQHSFHTDCIKMWLLDHDDCPLCRTILISPS